MSHATVYKNQQRYFKSFYVPTDTSWYVLRDTKGKVRDWVAARDAKESRRLFEFYRSKPIPKGYTVEKRGPVTKENW